MGLAASAEYFSALGLSPALGRFYSSVEDRDPGSHALVVLGHQFWQNRLGGDRNILGRTIDINRRRFTIVGVAPADYRGHVVGVNPDVYFPLTMWSIARAGFDSWTARRASWVTTLARLREGASIEQANAELAAIFQRMPDRPADARNQRGATVQSLTAVPGGGRAVIAGFLSLLLGLVVLVLLITCANVAGMLIARATAREREVAIRLAIGSSRAAIVRQLMLESLLLFALGGLGGLALARWGAQAISRIQLPVPIPVALDFRANLTVLLTGLALALATGLLFGLAPALQASRASVVGALKSESTRARSRGGRLRRTFVIAQIAFSLILLACSGLFLRSLQRATRIESGFHAPGVHTVMVNLQMDGYDETRGAVFQQTLVERLAAHAGVERAAWVEDLPLDLSINENTVFPERSNAPAQDEGIDAAFSRASAGYFATLRIPLLAGREFRSEDVRTAPGVIIVSRSFAEEVWPGQDPLGKSVRFALNDPAPMTVVGVVGDVKHKTLMDVTQPTVYLPLAQRYEPAMYLVVRGAITPVALRAAILQADPRLSFSLIQPLDQYTSLGTMPQRIAATLTTSLGLLALLLSALGVYGVVAFMVAQRTREIGTRMALGADRARVLRLVVADGLRLAAPGLVIGLLAAVGIGQLVRSFILGVAPLDPFTFTLVPIMLLAVVALACWAPARRAASVQPIQALKSE